MYIDRYFYVWFRRVGRILVNILSQMERKKKTKSENTYLASCETSLFSKNNLIRIFRIPKQNLETILVIHIQKHMFIKNN